MKDIRYTTCTRPNRALTTTPEENKLLTFIAIVKIHRKIDIETHRYIVLICITCIMSKGIKNSY
jgi:hypothetical protein